MNGALPAAEVLARTLARHCGGTAEIHEHTRLFVLGELVEPPSPPGRLRAAATADAELSLAWFQGFLAEAAEQAGRPHPPAERAFHDEDLIAGKIARQEIWLWEAEDGEVVHLTAPTPRRSAWRGSVRSSRRRRTAAAATPAPAVAAVSRRSA